MLERKYSSHRELRFNATRIRGELPGYLRLRGSVSIIAEVETTKRSWEIEGIEEGMLSGGRVRVIFFIANISGNSASFSSQRIGISEENRELIRFQMYNNEY